MMRFCNQLSYRRSLTPGKAVFFYRTDHSDFIPLRVETTKIVGQKSGFSEAYDAGFVAKNQPAHTLSYGNPQTIDVCYVPPNINEICCRFSMRAEANSLAPEVCSDPEVRKELVSLAERYKKAGGFLELGRRYAKNLLMGTWLWRNQHTMGTRIQISTTSGETYLIPDSRLLGWFAPWPEGAEDTLTKLAGEIAKALGDPHVYWFADVLATLRVGFCQEIFPSQRFVEKEHSNESSKQLVTIECPDGQKAAAINAQKIGAAIQQIDDWWTEDVDNPLRVHEYGADKKNVTALRHPTAKNDFYTLLLKSDVIGSGDAAETVSDDFHFLMSVLVKGGLFQGTNK